MKDTPLEFEDVVSPQTASHDDEEKLFHLVQDDDLIRHIHAVEIPPNSYYEELKKHLMKLHPDVEMTFIDHCVLVAGAFDTAAAFALSFGIKKFQLAQHEVQLVGEIVGREGRKPNPAMCKAIRNWPPVKTLKDLQSFLGTCALCSH